MGGRLKLVRNPRTITAKVNIETDTRLEIECAKHQLAKSDAVEMALRLLLEVLENPKAIDTEEIRDGELRRFLERLLERREKALVKPVA